VSTVHNLPAMDVHGHYGPNVQSGTHPLRRQFMSGDPAVVVARARSANIRYTVVSPLLAFFPRGGADVVAGNEEACRVVQETEGLLQWVVVDPRQPATFQQARAMLEQPKCMGIKLHPEEHGYKIAEQGRAVFELAAELRAVVLAHSGQANSLPDDFVHFADDFPEAILILAHLGNGGGVVDSPELQVRAIQASRHGNIYADTSSAQSLLPGLIEWAVGEVGAEHILFGTDTPLYFAPSQRARIDHADLSDAQKQLILWGNAARILPIPDEIATHIKK
jgi:uncharacterized protein